MKVLSLFGFFSALAFGSCQHIDDCTTGGETIPSTNINGTLKSPPSSSSERSCLWVLRIPANKVLKITFTKFDLKELQLCETSYVDITDKATTTNRYCGKDIPAPVTYTGPQSLIIYHSVGRINDQPGIEIQYTQMDQAEYQECLGGQFLCRNGKCIDRKNICNKVDECADGTDEENCGYTTQEPESCGTPVIKPDVYNEDRIVGGQEAIPGSWPWQISIQKKDIFPSGHLCGGSLINNFWIVTAGHCFERRQGAMVRIKLGDHHSFKTEKEEVTRYVQKVIVHPAYDTEPKNDIALLKLSAPVDFTDRVSPVCLPSLNGTIQEGDLTYITGWGETMTHGPSDVLRQAATPIISYKKCNDLYYGTVSLNTICTLNVGGGNSPCNGDSGGPLVMRENGKWALNGIVSWGHKMCGQERGPAVYTDVQKFVPWIRKIIQSE